MADETPRTRRQLLAAAIAAAGGALATHALGVADTVEAANADAVRVGQSFTGTSLTSITNTGSSSTAVAIQGVVSNSGTGTIGVWGQSNGSSGTGVFGVVTDTGVHTKGVYGRSVNGHGVHGEATGMGSGGNTGVYGTAAAYSGSGVYGAATDALGQNYGVYGTSASYLGVGVYGHAPYTALYGDGGKYGVIAHGSLDGVFAYSHANGLLAHGKTGVSAFGTKYGVSASSSGYGLYADGTKYAGYFTGKVHVEGTLSATTKHFLIDHPQDPANRTLSHACVEAPEMLTVYSGTATLGAGGSATVRLPRYFGALNTDVRYQLTPIGPTSSVVYVAREVSRAGTFRIGGGTPGQKVCWQLTGVRHDASAKRSPLRVEQAKARIDRGRYLDPAAFGKPASAAMHPVPRVKVPRVQRPKGIRPAA